MVWLNSHKCDFNYLFIFALIRHKKVEEDMIGKAKNKARKKARNKARKIGKMEGRNGGRERKKERERRKEEKKIFNHS